VSQPPETPKPEPERGRPDARGFGSFGLSLTPDFSPAADPAADPAELPIPPARVGDVITALDKAVRARRLYQDTNPAYQAFVRSSREAFARLWDEVPEIVLQVEERTFLWHGHAIAVGEGRENLAFTFYKDGIRSMTFMVGFEEEVDAFLAVLHHIRVSDQQNADDMVTLLWEREFTGFQYTYVDTLAEGVELPSAEDAAAALPPLSLDSIRLDLRAELDAAETPPAVAGGAPPVAAQVTHRDFSETLYLLDDDELAELSRELQREMERDVRTDVLFALFDRLEDRIPERQREIMQILDQLLPTLLAAGDLRSAATVLTELDDLTTLGVLEPESRESAAGLLRQLSDPSGLRQLLDSMIEGSIQPTAEELNVFMAHLGAPALPVLLSSAAAAADDVLRERLTRGLEGLAMRHTDALVALLAESSATVAAGAARLAGRLGMRQAGPRLTLLLKHPEQEVRAATVEALLLLRDARALEAVQQALDDPDRDVRLTAARGLAGLRYHPARPRLEAAVTGRLLRDGDLSERMAFFEAYATIPGPDSVDVLDRVLNGRRLLGRHDPEVRACAALALGRIATPAAFTALRRADGDANPVVRSAVTKALRQEVSP
jgi:HEAT repeat protein